jgi:hypothetical protein
VCKILIITLAFEKNANFSAENCRKLWSSHRPQATDAIKLGSKGGGRGV